MKKDIVKIDDNTLELHASFDERLGHERRLRFYIQDAIEYVSSFFSNGVEFENVESPNTISNYRQPYSVVWRFKINPSKKSAEVISKEVLEEVTPKEESLIEIPIAHEPTKKKKEK